MTIGEALKNHRNIEIELLLAGVLNKPKEFIFLHPEFILTSKHLNILSKYIKRREKGEPVAYVLGYKDFMGLRFKVNKDVLIPRPETEGMVEKVIERLKDLRFKNSEIKILDVGTGSGCVAVSLAKILPGKIQDSRFIIHASDISKKALKVAKANAKAHGVKIRFIHSDILQNMRMSYDVIVANLPYGWNEWKNNSSVETVGLKFEPKQALFTGEKGLLIIRKLLRSISSLKHKPKYIFLEFDPRQKARLLKLIKKSLPKSHTHFYKDINKFWRFCEIISY